MQNKDKQLRLGLMLGLFGTVTVVTGGCSKESDATFARSPVLADCVESVIERIQSAPDSSEYAARYVAFDQTLDEAPKLVGFVEVSGVGAERERLTALANGFATDCNREWSSPTDLTSTQAVNYFVEELQSLVMDNGYRGISVGGAAPRPIDESSVLLTYEDGWVRLHYNLAEPE